MKEQLELQNQDITALYVVTDTIPAYRQMMKTLGAITVHDSQAVYKLGRFTMHWLDAEIIAQTLGPLAPAFVMAVLGTDWHKAEERFPLDGSIRGWLKQNHYRFVYGKDLRQYEGIGL